MASVGFVYFMGADGSDVVKVGYAADPHSRIRQVQTGNPEKLAIPYMLPAGREVERLIHTIFAKHRRHGEWFDAEPLLLAAKHLTDVHLARSLRNAGLAFYPWGDDAELLRLVEIFERLEVTIAEAKRAIADAFSELAESLGQRRRKPITVV